MADNWLFIMNTCSPIFEHFIPLCYSSFTQYIFAIKNSQFIMDFCVSDVLRWRGRTTAQISQLAGHVTHAVETRTNTKTRRLVMMVCKATSNVMLLRIHQLSPIPTLVAWNKWRLLSEQDSYKLTAMISRQWLQILRIWVFLSCMRSIKYAGASVNCVKETTRRNRQQKWSYRTQKAYANACT
jgi:hypothetical protein